MERLIACESGWEPTNEENGVDHGLWQINDVHKVPREKMLDPIWSTRWAMQKWKDDGGFSAWTCGNCVSYLRAYYYPNMPKMADLKANTRFDAIREGAVAIFQYKTLKHVAYVSSVTDDSFIVKECNFKSGYCGQRTVQKDDPYLLGVWFP